MKILLISPSGVMYRKGGIFPRALRYAPLTLTTLASLIPKDIDAEVEIIDEGVSTLDLSKKADLVGITAITGTAKRSYAIAEHFRKKGSTVVLGGVHPTLMPEEAMQYADAVVTGLAFETWPLVIRDFKEGKLKKLYIQTDDNLSNLPIARRDLLKKFAYISNSSMQATFGCPHRCDFCAVVATQKKYLHRPVSEVIKELKKINGTFVVFVDPSPTLDKNYIKELWTAMIPLKIKWGGLSTVQSAEEDELMDLAAKSGCKGLLLGFETVYQEGVDIINKGFNKIDRYKIVVKKLHDKGIAVNGTFMFGMDTDDKSVFRKAVEFVNEVKIDLPRYAIITPFPGTAIYNRLEKEGRILTKNWTLYDGQHVVFEPAKMTPKELQEGLYWAWKKTYKTSSILHRSFGAAGYPFLSLFTNFAYRYYAYRLQNYPSSLVEKIEKKWNPSPLSNKSSSKNIHYLNILQNETNPHTA